MFGFFRKKAEKEEVDRLKEAVQTGFNNVKDDIGNLGEWVKHLDSNNNDLKEDILAINDGYVSVTPIKLDLTDHDYIEKLNSDLEGL